MRAKPLNPSTIVLSVVLSLFSSNALAKLPSFLKASQITESTRLPIAGKKTVCTATMNSANEKILFEKKLNPNEFQFVELTMVDQWAPQTDTKKTWFGRACESKIKCDILIISGHFATDFFGESNKNLTASELESHSCLNDCSGILSNPKEVFLFGCNTLATKEGDMRSREQYIQILRDEDNFSQVQAERVAEGRYGVTGEQNRERMRRSFLNVPYIYGFKTKAPLGRDIEPFLAKYVDQAQPYENHLNAIAAQAPARNADNFINELLDFNLKNIRHKGLSQCAGLSTTNPNSAEYKIHLNLCQFHTLIADLNEKIKFAEELLAKSEGSVYLPTIIEYFVSREKIISETAAASFNQFKNNMNSKATFLKYLPEVKGSVMRSEWLVFGRMMNWISETELHTEALALYKKHLTPPLESEVSGMVCAFHFKGKYALNNQEMASLFTPEHFKSYPGLQMIYCSSVLQSDSMIAMLSSAIKQSITTDSAFLGAQIAMLESKDIKMSAATTDLANELISICSNSNNADVLQGCLSSFNNLKYKTPAVLAIAQKSISLPGNIAGALTYLAQENQKYQGPESHISSKMKSVTGTALVIFGQYFKKFPPTDQATKTLALAKCQTEGIAVCSDLIEAIKTLQVSETDYNTLVNTPGSYISQESWQSLYLFSAAQSNFTPSMAANLFKQSFFIGRYETVFNALKELMANQSFLLSVSKNQMALKNMCQTLNSNSGTSKLDCFTALMTSSAANENFAVIKDLALQTLETRNIANPSEALKFLIQFRGKLSDGDKQKIRNFREKSGISDDERSLARKAL